MSLAFHKMVLSGFIFILVFSSCTHYYYGPNSNNIPLLEKKGDGRIAANASMTLQTSGFELQSAYAIGNHFGALLNLYGVASGTSTTTNSNGVSETEEGKAHYAELGAGYFTPLNDQKDKIIFEAYGGAGVGTVHNYYTHFTRSKVGVSKLFVQPSFGFTNEKGDFSMAVSGRVSFVKLRVKSETLNSASDARDINELMDIRNNGNNIYFEPSALIRFGGKKLKLQLQTTGCHALQHKLYRSQSGIATIGVMYCF